MRIRIWNAFASNNSGSYTIVGSFSSPEQAAEIVSVLAPAIEAHTRWMEKHSGTSPLEKLAAQEKLPWHGGATEWPEYGGKESPEVVALGSQVLLHHSYTTSLPTFFGQFFTARGGVVDMTLDHAHHDLVAVFEVYWPWNSVKQEQIPELSRALVEELVAHEGALDVQTKAGVEPVVRPWAAWDKPLVIATVFGDLVAGTAAVQNVIGKHRALSRLRIMEAMDANGDPLAFARARRP